MAAEVQWHGKPQFLYNAYFSLPGSSTLLDFTPFLGGPDGSVKFSFW